MVMRWAGIMPRFLLLAALLGICLPGLLAHPRDVYPVRSGPSALSLNGSWEFTHAAGSIIGSSDVVFNDPDLANTTDWKNIAFVSGHGTKFVEPDVCIKAEAGRAITGSFILLPLAKAWRARLTSWFGAPSAVQYFQPYFHSHDQ